MLPVSTQINDNVEIRQRFCRAFRRQPAERCNLEVTMNRSAAWLATAMLCASAHGQSARAADHHQHLFSPDVAALISPPWPLPSVKPISGDDLIALLDDAGIEGAAVLSVAYIWGSPQRKVDNE
jgi:hypothetical protein